MDNGHRSDVGGSRSASHHSSGQIPAVRRCVPEYLTIATVLSSWGTRGEAKVRIETDFPDRFTLLTRVYLGAEHQVFELEGFRQHSGYGLLKLKGCDSPEAAGKLRGMEVQIPLADAMPLPAGQYYVYQIEGLAVFTEDGKALGTIDKVLFTGSNAVYVIHGPRGEVLIPKIEGVVLEVDLKAGRMTVRPPPGLLD